MKTNWQTKKIGEVIVENPKSKIKVRDSFYKGKYIFFKSGEKTRFFNDFFCEGENIFMATGGKAVIKFNKGKAAYSTDTYSIRGKNDLIETKYLYYFILTQMNIIEKKMFLGAAIKHLQKKDFKNLEVPLPSLEEQKRIIQILDEIFNSISQSKENAEKNLKNAKELFESYLEEIFLNPKENWEEKKLEELSKKKNAIVSGPFGSNLKVKDYIDEGIPLIRLQNIQRRLFLDKDIKYISPEKAEELKSHSFIKGDVVLAKLGIPIGKTCRVPDEFEEGIIVADVVRIRLDKDKVDYDFITYFLNSNNSTKQLTGNIVGATRPRVNLSNVREIKLSLPKSISEQKQIVQKLDALSKEIKELETIYKQKIKDLEELKKSMLHKAFSGELTKE